MRIRFSKRVFLATRISLRTVVGAVAIAGLIEIAVQVQGATVTVWNGAASDGDLGNATNWSLGLPVNNSPAGTNNGKEAEFDAGSLNYPTTGSIAPYAIYFNGNQTTAVSATSITITALADTLADRNIQNYNSNTPVSVSANTITMDLSATTATTTNSITNGSPLGIVAGNIAAGTGKLTIGGGTFTFVGSSFNSTTIVPTVIQARNADLDITSTTFNLSSYSGRGSTSVNALGSVIANLGKTVTITPAITVGGNAADINTNTGRNATFGGAGTILANGGFAGNGTGSSGGNVFWYGTGTFSIGSSQSWGGNVSIGNRALATAGNIEISASDSLGAAGSAASGYTDMIASTGTVVINGTGLTVPEFVYTGLRSSAIAAHISNKIGNNTFNGTLLTEGTAGNVGLESQAGKLTVSSTGFIKQDVATTATLNLFGAGDGEIQTPITQNAVNKIWNVAKTSGAGTWTLNAANSYTGTTTVSAGKLLVNGTNSGNGAFTVSSGAILGGTGSVGTSTINVNGTLSPGASIESLASGAVNLNALSTFQYEFDSSASGLGDLLVANGNVVIDPTATFSLTDAALIPGSLPAVGSKLTLINYSGSETGVFSGYGDGSIFTLGSNTFQINYHDTTGGSNFAAEQTLTGGFVTLTVQAVPEPGTLLLSGLSLVGLGVGGLRHRRKANI